MPKCSSLCREAERAFIIECIRLYRDLPSLWRVGSKEYTDRILKNQSYEILLAKYREKYPEADREDLKMKFNSLRTNFRKELKKVEESMKYGAEHYASHLWYYNELLFLKELEYPRDREITNEIDEPYPVNCVETDGSLRLEQVKRRFEEEVPGPHFLAEQSQGISGDIKGHIGALSYTSSKRTKTNSAESSSCHCTQSSDDDYLTVAKAWAVELRRMDHTQQILAKKFISDVLFEGQMGYLHIDSISFNRNHPQYPTNQVESYQPSSVKDESSSFTRKD